MSRRTHPTTPEPDPLLSPLELAHYLGISKRTVDDWRSEGNDPGFVRLGSSPRSRIRYRRSTVDAWLESNQVQ